MQLEENIALYEQEINEQAKALQIQEREFQVLETALPRAERAKRKAEVRLRCQQNRLIKVLSSVYLFCDAILSWHFGKSSCKPKPNI